MKVGDLKKILSTLDDDFDINIVVKRRLTEAEFKDAIYPYLFNMVKVDFEVRDICWSEKTIFLDCEIDKL